MRGARGCQAQSGGLRVAADHGRDTKVPASAAPGLLTPRTTPSALRCGKRPLSAPLRLLLPPVCCLKRGRDGWSCRSRGGPQGDVFTNIRFSKWEVYPPSHHPALRCGDQLWFKDCAWGHASVETTDSGGRSPASRRKAWWHHPPVSCLKPTRRALIGPCPGPFSAPVRPPHVLRPPRRSAGRRLCQLVPTTLSGPTGHC